MSEKSIAHGNRVTKTVRLSLSLAGPGLLICLFCIAPLEAQSVSGRVLDDFTNRPVAAATVTLLNAELATVGAASSSEGGFFQLRMPAAGSYTLRVQRIGYEDHEGRAFEVAAGEHVEVELRLSPEGVHLDPLVVLARRSFEPGREGFARRRDLGRGLFLDMITIAVAEPRVTTDVFRGLEGVQVVGAVRGGLLHFQLGSMRGHRCLAVFLDHAADPIMIQRSPTAPRLEPGVGEIRGGIGGGGGALRSEAPPEFDGWVYGSLDQLVDPSSLRGVEVFRDWTEVPDELRSGLRARHLFQGGPCGVVLVWTEIGW
ncbi:MAG: carboxypeptidase regulatory-like domain-containing protein [Gemmatimonadales bacterium]|nr:MAG: carboxypeptidase regulatory-like domain-containing protein [Gemmatimonadales bacterium]